MADLQQQQQQQQQQTQSPPTILQPQQEGHPHPLSLRPGGSRSGSPQPQQPLLSSYEQLETDPAMSSYQRIPSGAGPGSFGAPAPQSPPLPSSSSSAMYASARFPSQYFPPQSPTNEQATSSANPFADGPAGSRSRSSTIGQNYPIAVAPPMPTSPPQQSIQPLFAQHSGHAGSSSRPVSRSAPGGGPGSMGGSMPSMPTGSGGSGPSTRPTSAKSPFSPPITSPPRNRPHQILLINPNSTRSMTEAMLQSLRPVIPQGVEVTGYTAPYPAPTAIESTTDAIMSTEAVLRDLAKHAASNGETVQNYDGMIVACFSKHPLIDALRESYDVPIVGIMEASVYVARMLGGRFGIVATAQRSKIKQDDDIAAYGLSHFYVGSEATHLSVLELDSRPKEEVAKRVAHCARALVIKGADTILLGCAGMTDMVRAAKDAVRDEDGRRTVNVIDSVEAGVMMMNSLIGMGIPTSKKGMYKGEKEGRRTRGQNWL
ncbi:uncharacterized protein A1O5_07018 [Cladophialophora psammophila CBS 110553]|uniref:Asp/Glu/hydantoin racemase n=1 Tax=Cladophialophora psammophila CBS 110553 TaxID=1182543 RepID=W9WY22_9EURO|nr:uncharacterized protein A1O5_07018 [Cladophialophora psammophila CBS 110553]EXJ69945.1 hypothetical protein A1O5_07018 [Cladophialophora psammophila CBS 110553]